ncbi:alpha/beta hydrolase [Eggerthella guodeyinii]|nr:alpha/beta hydrolase [Eggerthella guodeyinii]
METNEPTSPACAADAAAPRRKPRKLVVVLAALAILLCVLAAAFFAYASDSYHDLDANHRNLVSTEALPVQQGTNYLAFGDPDAEVGLVFYPGAKVEYSAYAPLMRNLADRGYLAVVVQMPFNFAFFDINAADRVRADFPAVDTWWVGGHSLGGSMAAQYAADHADDGALDGLVLLGSYSASDLSDTDLGVISLYGSNDQVLNRTKLENNADLLPEGAATVEIEGGNHASFGTYGPQSGDGEATITPADQQTQTANVIDAYIRSLTPKDNEADQPIFTKPSEYETIQNTSATAA